MRMFPFLMRMGEKGDDGWFAWWWALFYIGGMGWRSKPGPTNKVLT